MGETILVIDDDTNIRRTFERILQSYGYETDSAQTGKEALQKTKFKRYTVVLVDLCLSDINGIELLEELDRRDPEMVKIVITGSQFDASDKGKIADALPYETGEASRSSDIDRAKDQRKACLSSVIDINNAISYTKAYTNTETRNPNRVVSLILGIACRVFYLHSFKTKSLSDRSLHI